MPLLTAKTLGLNDGHAIYSKIVESFLHFVELEWFKNGFNFFISDRFALY